MLSLSDMIIKEPVLIRIYYYMPDYSSLVQEFTWGTMDVIPEYPRINTFLNYLYNNIDAVISSIDINPYKEYYNEI